MTLIVVSATSASATDDPQRVIGRALGERGAYTRAVRLADEVGARLAGTPGAERAVAWALAEMKAIGLVNVHTEPVTLDSWHRGEDDRVEIVAPFPRRLRSLALGNSPGTPPAGLTAEVIEADSFEALRALGGAVVGKIVFFNHAMKRSRGFEEYGAVRALRHGGAIEASKLGAVAMILRSIGTGAHRLPHTGSVGSEPKVPAIPSAAIAAEDAELLHRALQRGRATLSMHQSSGPGPTVTSANVVGELRGHGKPDELVLLGAHLDSWDVGDGALDDGAGVGMVLEAARLLMEARPQRTIRVVLFMNEERGLSGARAYASAHAAELGRHVAAMEADTGAGAPLGFAANGGEVARAMVSEWARPLARLDASVVVSAEHLGADLIPLVGVPQVELQQDASDYFEWHHTDGDTADKIDPDAIDRATAALTFMAGRLADGRPLPRPAAPASR